MNNTLGGVSQFNTSPEFICEKCVNPIQWKCCHWCLKQQADGTIGENKHWDPKSGCDLNRDDRPKVCKIFKCEWVKGDK